MFKCEYFNSTRICNGLSENICNYNRCNRNRCVCMPGPRGPKGDKGDSGTPTPFLSSYAEGAGNTQTVASNTNVAFDDIEIVGSEITYNNATSEFTILAPGLYLVEWSLNLSAGNPEVTVGILENGSLSSAFSSTLGYGNLSSGTLINVTSTPFVISLFNFTQTFNIENPVQAENTCASIRIVKFAEGAKT